MIEDEEIPEIVDHPIDETLDLHTFQPKEAASLVEEYLSECCRHGYAEVRIIHGKGTGVLREIVHSVLSRSSNVACFREAPPERGGWGATIVVLQRTH